MSKTGVSIIVCTHNGKNRLPQTLAAINQLDAGIDRELILVDNASTDGTSELVRNYLTELCPDLGWNIIYEPVPGLSHARIAGLSAASFEYVLFCDDDNQLFKDYIDLGYRILKGNPEIGVLGGLGIPVFEIDKPEWFDRYSHSYAVGPQSDKSGIIGKADGYVYGAGTFFRKEPMLDILQSGFQLALTGRTKAKLISGDDLEWCWLIRLLGYSIHYSPELKFNHQLAASRLTWEYYLKLKRGISGSAGLLYSYQFFFENPLKSAGWFQFKYLREELRSRLLYLKYLILWKGDPQRPEDQLAFAILESQMKSYADQRMAAVTHFKQLKKYFGN